MSAMDLPRENYTVSLRMGDPGEVRLLQGDLTEYPSDAIVNAANSELLPGEGVCGAIHRKGGPEIAHECNRLRGERGPIKPGLAVATTAGQLRAKYVIHAVGPVWYGGSRSEAEVLSNCYRQSMRIADDLNLGSIAFPAISTGVYGYPVEQAAWVALPTLIESLRSAKRVVFVSIILFDKATLDVFAAAAIAQRRPFSGKPYELCIGILNA